MTKKCSKIKQQILEIIAASGEVFRYDLMHVTNCSKDYIRQNLSELKADNLIKESSFNESRTLRLTNVGKKFLMELFPGRYDTFFTGTSITNKSRSNPQRRERTLRMAQAIILFRQTGIKIFPDEKVLLNKTMTDNPDNIDAEFYSSMELKELFVEFNKSRGSRALGILVTKFCVYIVYNTCQEPMKWQNNTELKFRVTVENEIVRKRFKNTKDVKWLVIGSGYDMPAKLFDRLDSGQRKYMNIYSDNLEKNYVEFDRRSFPVMRLIVDRDLYEAFKEKIREEYGFMVQGTERFNDVDEDGYPLLFALDFDMKSVNDFVSYLYTHKMHGNIACFVYQIHYLQRYAGDPSGIYEIDDREIEEGMINAKSN